MPQNADLYAVFLALKKQEIVNPEEKYDVVGEPYLLRNDDHAFEMAVRILRILDANTDLVNIEIIHTDDKYETHFKSCTNDNFYVVVRPNIVTKQVADMPPYSLSLGKWLNGGVIED